MSNNASLSSAKRRRGGGPPASPVSAQNSSGGSVATGSLPAGLPPNFRQLPVQVQQQLLRQIQQQRNSSSIPLSQQTNSNVNKHISPNFIGAGIGNGIDNGSTAGNGPYIVNSVIHNRANHEVAGLHIRDLPMTSTGLPCLPSGAALPPNVLFKLHHDELLNQDANLNDYSNKLQILTNRVDNIEKVCGVSKSQGQNNNTDAPNKTTTTTTTNTSYENIVEDGNFISKVVDNILTNTNLSDIINQIEPLQKENESLRSLINSQQKTLNELSTLVMKLLNDGLPTYELCNTNYDMNNNEYSNYESITDVTAGVTAEVITKVDMVHVNTVIDADSNENKIEEADKSEYEDDAVNA